MSHDVDSHADLHQFKVLCGTISKRFNARL
ncbi:hypothetical protein BN10_590018 [Phycicoccus elongatus Lp2]|uniref:Uncharacterized protein n=1 Tax=Phycicoccus elongatus Lp2 TaxID=1193181 RepID=N0E3W5_9MICO|nr:hypothetical protein BN10_590018 [Phycicoccus elongatus Lp2]